MPASLAAIVPVFIATPDIRLSQRRRVVGAVAGHRDHPAARLLRANQRELVFGRRLRHEVVDARFGGNRGGGQRVVAGDHDGLDAHRAQVREPVADAAFHDVLQVDDAERAAVFGDRQRRSALAGDAIDLAAQLRRQRVAVLLNKSLDGVDGALADRAAVEVDARHAGVRRERHERRLVRGELASAQAVLLLGEHDDRAALRRLVGQRRELRGVGERRVADARRRTELGRLPVAQRDRAGLVEQQRIDVAGRFDRAAGHRQHVLLDEPVHAGDADRRDQRADRRRNQADQQRDQHGNRNRRAGVVGKRLERHHDEQEDERQHREQDVQRDLVRRLLPDGALDERDHAIEKCLARIGGDLHHDPVREHLRAAGHRGAIAARFADHRRGFAGDGRFVDAGDALDDLAVAGNHLPGFDADDVARAKAAGIDGLALAAGQHANGRGLGLRLAQRRRLRLAAPFGHRLGEVGEQDGEPEPERDLPGEQRVARAAGQLLDPDDRRDQAADLDDEHHGILELNPRIELAERIGDRLPDDGRIPDRNPLRARSAHLGVYAGADVHVLPWHCRVESAGGPVRDRRARGSAPAR